MFIINDLIYVKNKEQANKTHYEVGKKVRKTIEELGGTMPENLPVAESIKQLVKNNQNQHHQYNQNQHHQYNQH